MSSDSAYAAFLDKANQGLETATATDKPSKKDDHDSGFISSKTLDVDEQRVPPSLRVDAFYSSETDEPFEPVVLALDHFPSEDEFPQLVHGSTAPNVQVSVLSPAQFDRRGQYTSVLEAVKAACSSTASASAAASAAEVRVYRVQHDHSRAEYWLLALDVDGGRLLGLKARAVET
ncbi:hypothetical protein A7D00_3568 [Trichophyton violaceum]|uniref:Uncharacterized protein n=1 Tax=Trichophyton violaceum TaxID=34388 RepID=A0A178FKS2_TRIVO|nr:hypothetical protein A7D00_3568 [Trichophyton violaceum]